MPRDKNLPAHHVEKGDPRIDGPYLDDIRADQERAYREARAASNNRDITRDNLEVEFSDEDDESPVAPPEAEEEENEDTEEEVTNFLLGDTDGNSDNEDEESSSQ